MISTRVKGVRQTRR